MTEPRHPAKYGDEILEALREVAPRGRVLDPFAGVGRIHRLEAPDRETFAVELERGFIAAHPRTIQGNALRLPFADDTFDGIVTSPTYGNRMADRYDGRDGSTRATYRLALGTELHADNSGGMQWGAAYRAFHLEAWIEARRVLRPGGRFVLNMKDHVRGGAVQPVTEWHIQTLEVWLSMSVVEVLEVAAPGLRFGANHDARVDVETIHVLE